MRHGPGSTSAQAMAQAEFTRSGGVNPWPRTKPFGTRKMPLRTLLATGRYRTALSQRVSGVVEIRAPHVVGFRLDRFAFPQWPVFQAHSPTVIRAKSSHRTKTGKLAMQMFLGLTFGVWISERNLLNRGLTIQPRRVSENPVMWKRVIEVYRAYILAARSGSPRYSSPARPFRLPTNLRRAA